MKKNIFRSLILLAVLLFLPTGADAQKYIIQKTNGEQVVLNYADVESIIFTESQKMSCEFVDLGLSVKWATCNVGAETPEDYGWYIAWGETAEKDFFGVDNSETAGQEIVDFSGDEKYDAATANYDGGARMPTKAEYTELIEKCTWEWAEINSIGGMVVTGPNGGRIFLPAAGKMMDSEVAHEKTDGRYWSSTSYSGTGSINYAFGYGFCMEGNKWEIWEYRGDGHSVRAVCDK